MDGGDLANVGFVVLFVQVFSRMGGNCCRGEETMAGDVVKMVGEVQTAGILVPATPCWTRCI